MAVKKKPALTVSLGMIQAALEEAVKKIEPELRPVLVRAYRGEVDYKFEQAMQEAQGSTQRGEFGSTRHWSHGHYRWMKTDKAYVDRMWDEQKISPRHFERPDWGVLREHPGAFKVDYTQADRDAETAFENARDSFVHKNLGKFEFVLGHRNDVQSIDVNAGWRSGVFDGSVKVELEGAELLASVGLKYVVRTVPNVTPYYQYPLLFTMVKVGSQVYRGQSELEVRELLGGGAAPTEAEILASKGLCPGSGQQVPAEVWKKIYMMAYPYARCPVCGESVSAQRGKFRAHKTVAAQRSELLAKGFCEMSDQPIPPEVVRAAVEAAVKKSPFYEQQIRGKPFDSYDVRFPCTVCKWKGGSASSRSGIYKQHKTR